MLYAYVSLVCMAPTLFGNIPDSIQKRAEYVCRTRYSGCVRSIRELGPLQYHVTCYRNNGVRFVALED